jgi:hypothetical protein
MGKHDGGQGDEGKGGGDGNKPQGGGHGGKGDGTDGNPSDGRKK